MNWSKIISGAKAFITLLTKMKGLFSLANLKTLAIVAAVVLLALIVEDFINFLMGMIRLSARFSIRQALAQIMPEKPSLKLGRK